LPVKPPRHAKTNPYWKKNVKSEQQGEEKNVKE
jgi:hypothetical protein